MEITTRTHPEVSLVPLERILGMDEEQRKLYDLVNMATQP